MFNVAIRVDSSRFIGTGHVARMLVLASELRSLGAGVIFVCKQYDGAVYEKINEKNFDCVLIPDNSNHGSISANPSSWLGTSEEVDFSAFYSVINKRAVRVVIVDHYAIGATWHMLAKNYGFKVIAIDDIAGRKFAVDILVNQNYGVQESLYDGLIIGQPTLLLGAKYAMLAKDYRIYTSRIKRDYYNKNHINLFLFMGGVDDGDVISNVVKELHNSKVKSKFNLNIAVGAAYPYLDKLIKTLSVLTGFMKYSIHVGLPTLSNLINCSDIGIAAGGTNTWERCCLGLPTIIIPVADNQLNIAGQVSQYGAAMKVELTEINGLVDVLESLLASPKKLKSMSKMAMQIVDSYGANRLAHRIIDEYE